MLVGAGVLGDLPQPGARVMRIQTSSFGLGATPAGGRTERYDDQPRAPDPGSIKGCQVKRKKR